jgi:hypothetical protein
MKRVILICGCAALALAACSKSTETKVTEKTTTTSKAAPPPEAPTAPPTRKAGLWEQTMTTPQMTQTIKMCVDEATEANGPVWSTERHGGKTDCKEQSVTPTAGGVAFHSVCASGDGGTVTSDGTATGDFGSHYRVEVTSVTSGSSMPQANSAHKMSMDGVWKGPCPAGMKGGDMEMPGGMRVSTAGGAPHVESGPGGADMAKLRAQAMAGHVNQADIAKMKAQAEAMKAQMKQ